MMCLRKNILLYGVCSLSLVAATASAGQLKIFINSGTGFVVSSDGYIVTNQHVVNYCEKIIISGVGIQASEAHVTARDADDDLALLKANAVMPNVGQFSTFRDPLKTGDRALIVGYPGQAALKGETVTRETQILETKGPQGEDKWVQLGDVVEQGNSGGPLMDTTGNIIGVVSAKVMTYTYRKDQPENGTTRQFGVAIAVPVVENFLDHNGIHYRTSDSGDFLSADRITDNAHRFVVNVRCEYKTELR